MELIFMTFSVMFSMVKSSMGGRLAAISSGVDAAAHLARVRSLRPVTLGVVPFDCCSDIVVSDDERYQIGWGDCCLSVSVRRGGPSLILRPPPNILGYGQFRHRVAPTNAPPALHNAGQM